MLCCVTKRSYSVVLWVFQLWTAVISVCQALRTELTTLCPLLANPDYRHHPYAQPMNASFTDVDSLLFALQIASAMDHLTQRNVSSN